MSSFALKIIAIISMFCDHFGDVYIGHYSFLNLIGRIAFPIFAFQISEGFIHTKNIKKYFIRLGIFALISQVPFSLFVNKYLNSSIFSLNVFFTLFLGLLSIYLYDYVMKLVNKVSGRSINIDNIKTESNNEVTDNTIKSKSLQPYVYTVFGLIIVLLIAYIAEILNTDYGFWGVIVVFIFYLFKKDKLAMIITFITLCIIKYGIQILESSFNIPTLLLGVFTTLSIVFISLYNGKQGKKIKYLLYFFYPIHLLLLYFIF